VAASTTLASAGGLVDAGGLEKEPGRRYASGREVADELERFVAGKPIEARPVGFWEPSSGYCFSRREGQR